MSDVDDNLSNALNLPKPESEPKQEVVKREVKSISTGRTEADRDYTEVRDNLKRIIEKSEEAIENILEDNRNTNRRVCIIHVDGK